MKKLLSIVLALALCLTAFVGCLTVSAAGENTIVVDTANITTGAATTDVNVTITSAGVMALQFAIDYGTLAAPAVAYDEDAVTVTATEDKTGLIVEADANFTSTVITLTFDTAALTAGTYAITVNDVEAGNYDEAIVAFETTAGAIVVADEVVEPTCEHENLDYVESTSDGVTDGSITLVCADCGETMTKTATFNKYARAGYVGAIAEEQTLISFGAYYQKDLTRVNANAVWSEIYIILEQTRNDELIDTAVYSMDDIVDTASDSTYRVTYGLAAYMYADDVTATVFAYDSVSDTWYTGAKHKNSLKALAESLIPTFTGVQQSMWVDLLNYGAAAQVNFNKNTENLANSNIDAYQSVATTPAEYTKTVSYARSDDPIPFFYYQFNGVVESKITLRSYVRLPSNYTGTYANEDGSNITAVATWTDYLGREQRYEATMEDGLDYAPGYTNRWNFYLPIGAPDLRTDITFAVYDGDTLVSLETVASMEAYVNDNYDAANDNFKALCDAMMAFGDSANTYFTSK